MTHTGTSLVIHAAALTSVVALSAVVVAAAPPPTNKQSTNSPGIKVTTTQAGEFLMGATPEEIADRRKQLIDRSGDYENALEIRKHGVGLALTRRAAAARHDYQKTICSAPTM